jgi:hypothetical protein
VLYDGDAPAAWLCSEWRTGKERDVLTGKVGSERQRLDGYGTARRPSVTR